MVNSNQGVNSNIYNKCDFQRPASSILETLSHLVYVGVVLLGIDSQEDLGYG